MNMKLRYFILFEELGLWSSLIYYELDLGIESFTFIYDGSFLIIIILG